jgi:diaminobutyrate-2-oxoglutarate transaminase
MAAGSATIQFIKKNKLTENAAKMGALFVKNLEQIQSQTTCLGDIRGKGLMLGVEIVNTISGKLQSGQPERFEILARKIQAECFNRGLIIEIGGRQSSVLRFLPPLTITTEQVNHICQIFRDALQAAEKAVFITQLSLN